MKTSLIALSLASAIGASVFAPAAMASDGTITINGQISATTCTVTAGGSADGNKTITLPTVSNTVLTSAGAKSGLTSFSINLSGASCTNGAAAKAVFDGGQINLATGRLTNSGTATNVEVGLVNSDGSDIKLGDATTIKGATVAGNAATLNYGAQYVSLGGATQGSVASSVTYSISYN